MCFDLKDLIQFCSTTKEHDNNIVVLLVGCLRIMEVTQCCSNYGQQALERKLEIFRESLGNCLNFLESQTSNINH